MQEKPPTKEEVDILIKSYKKATKTYLLIFFLNLVGSFSCIYKEIFGWAIFFSFSSTFYLILIQILYWEILRLQKGE